MENRNLNAFKESMNRLAGKGESFLFIIDYSLKSAILIPTSECDSHDIYYDFAGVSNRRESSFTGDIRLQKHPVPYSQYLEAFEYVRKEIHKGNSYLVNLTFPTPVECNLSLSEIFHLSKAPYKLLYKNLFLVFSPECFIKITNGTISTFPMKGTIDASLEDAKNILLTNEKETAEHATIVDLLRNDLSRVATNIHVEKYRYIDKINTSEKSLLQMSSIISGDLPEDYLSKLGDIITDLLPAGSICGAPKKATLKIIAEAEKYDRGFYTGVFGIFDGTNLDSGVMIRYIENREGQLVYKSGGGITAKSDPEEEYQELIDKIYVPVN